MWLLPNEKKWKKEQQKFRQTKHHTQTKHLDVYHFKSKWILKKEREMFEWIKKIEKGLQYPSYPMNEWTNERGRKIMMLRKQKTKQKNQAKPTCSNVGCCCCFWSSQSKDCATSFFFCCSVCWFFFSIFLLWFDLIWLFGMRAMWFSHF